MSNPQELILLHLGALDNALSVDSPAYISTGKVVIYLNGYCGLPVYVD